jgi:hypothetical protein
LGRWDASDQEAMIDRRSLIKQSGAAIAAPGYPMCCDSTKLSAASAPMSFKPRRGSRGFGWIRDLETFRRAIRKSQDRQSFVDALRLRRREGRDRLHDQMREFRSRLSAPISRKARDDRLCPSENSASKDIWTRLTTDQGRIYGADPGTRFFKFARRAI